MAYKLRTAVRQAIYRLRKSTVEPVIGIIKETLGFRQFSLRGLDGGRRRGVEPGLSGLQFETVAYLDDQLALDNLGLTFVRLVAAKRGYCAT